MDENQEIESLISKLNEASAQMEQSVSELKDITDCFTKGKFIDEETGKDASQKIRQISNLTSECKALYQKLLCKEMPAFVQEAVDEADRHAKSMSFEHDLFILTETLKSIHLDKPEVQGELAGIVIGLKNISLEGMTEEDYLKATGTQHKLLDLFKETDGSKKIDLILALQNQYSYALLGAANDFNDGLPEISEDHEGVNAQEAPVFEETQMEGSDSDIAEESAEGEETTAEYDFDADELLAEMEAEDVQPVIYGSSLTHNVPDHDKFSHKRFKSDVSNSLVQAKKIFGGLRQDGIVNEESVNASLPDTPTRTADLFDKLTRKGYLDRYEVKSGAARYYLPTDYGKNVLRNPETVRLLELSGLSKHDDPPVVVNATYAAMVIENIAYYNQISAKLLKKKGDIVYYNRKDNPDWLLHWCTFKEHHMIIYGLFDCKTDTTIESLVALKKGIDDYSPSVLMICGSEKEQAAGFAKLLLKQIKGWLPENTLICTSDPFSDQIMSDGREVSIDEICNKLNPEEDTGNNEDVLGIARK